MLRGPGGSMRNEAVLKKNSMHFELASSFQEENSLLYQGYVYVATFNCNNCNNSCHRCGI